MPKYKLNSAQTEVVEISNMAVNGCADAGTAGFEGRVVQRRFDENIGTILQGYSEQSNVSVVEEFINLIVAQRGYEANSKVLQTTSDMLSVLNNLHF